MKHLPKKTITWNFQEHKPLLQWNNVSTVCEESKCPNRRECSDAKQATFLIGGSVCTRACAYCNVETGSTNTPLPDKKEIDQIIDFANTSQTKYIVITSVTRDDDPGGLAGQFAVLTEMLHQAGVLVELLIPDFIAHSNPLKIVTRANPAVLAHNMEAVSSLWKIVRPQGSFKKSLEILQFIHDHYPNIIVKSGFMIGLGETKDEIFELIRQIGSAGVDILTIGQYLQPAPHLAPVEKYYTEEEFFALREYGLGQGLKVVESGPFVRSSYKAFESYKVVKN